MLDLMRSITFSNREVLAGAWEPTGGYTAHRTQGRTVGLVFFGNIARAMASIVQALGMNVVVWAPTKTREDLAQAGCTKAETLDELLAALDENISSNGTRGIRAAALDVLADETAPNRALIEHPRCIVTPHTAYCTEEANDTLRRMTLKAQIDYLVRGIMPEHVVEA